MKKLIVLTVWAITIIAFIPLLLFHGLQEYEVEPSKLTNGINTSFVQLTPPTQKRDILLTIGISACLRNGEIPYLGETLNRTISSLGRWRNVTKIIVLIVERDEEKIKTLTHFLEIFALEKQEGVLEVTIPPQEIYEPLSTPCKLRNLHNDSLARILWRSKQVPRNQVKLSEPSGSRHIPSVPSCQFQQRIQILYTPRR
jgi:hypothetical protein